MDKYIYNTKNGLWYELQGDYYLPCLKLPKEESRHIGVWGQRHLRYLKQYHNMCYYNLLIRGKLNDYLAAINEQAAFRKGCCQATAAFLFREVFKKS